MYKTWLFNNKKKKERKDMIKYGRKWTPRMVIYQQNQGEVLKRIEDESGEKPGAPSMFKHYQAAVKGVMAELDDNELERQKKQRKNGPTTFLLPRYKHKLLVRRNQHIWSTFRKRCGVKVILKGYRIRRASASARTLCPFPEYSPLFQNTIRIVSEDPDGYCSVSEGPDDYRMISRYRDK
jgi:hypothetical protein